MKKLILYLTAALLFATTTRAQITYEHTYTAPPTEANNMWLTNLGNNNYKFIVWDYIAYSFSMYNLDHSPYMLNIPVPVTNAGHYYDVGYVSTTLFDCDSTNIEYAVIGDYPSSTKKFWVFRTDGTLIFSRDSVTTLWCVGCAGGSQEVLGIVNTPVGTKLYLAYQYPDATQETYVYGLCGTLPENITEVNHSNNYVQVFPNPTSRQLNFAVTLPSHLETQGTYELTIFNSKFQTIKTIGINSISSQLQFDTETLSSGEYYYSLQTKDKVLQYGKFIVTK